jgi:hypothetical protein
VRPQTDDYPEQLEAVLLALTNEGVEAGRAALEPIKEPPRVIPRRTSVARPVRCEVFLRDHFCCRYCGAKTIPDPLMALLGHVYPDEFPWHQNWRAGLTHPAVIMRNAAVDHVEPAAYGGTSEVANLVTACNPCNLIKRDFSLAQLEWELQPVSDPRWDGLTRFYGALWRIAGEPNPPYHLGWMRDLGLLES